MATANPNILTPGQRRRIFTLCRELGWDDDFRHEMLERWTGKTSLSTTAKNPISRIEAIQVIAELNTAVRRAQAGRAAQKKRIRRTYPPHTVTPEQLHKIDTLREIVFGDHHAAFRSWLHSRWSVEAPDWMTPKQAVGVILALEQMRESGWRPSRNTSP